MTSPVPSRLLADLAALAADHPPDAGLLGEYALTERQRGQEAAAEAYPSVVAHLRGGCERCQGDLDTLDALARRTVPSRKPEPPTRPAPAAAQPGEPPSEPSPEQVSPDVPEPIEISDAVALARVIEAEREALRAPLRPDRMTGQVDSRRQGARRRHLLLVEAALIRQRLVARQLFLDRAFAARAPGRHLNPKAGLLLDDVAGQVDDLGRLSGRISRLTADLRRLGDDPRGPVRSQADILTERGLTMTRDALAIDRRLARLLGPLAGMV
jgi:hypothetical protein